MLPSVIVIAKLHIVLTYLKASWGAAEGVRAAWRGGNPGCRWLQPARVWKAHSRKTGIITVLAGFQAVSGSFFFNLTGALGFREGMAGSWGSLCFVRTSWSPDAVRVKFDAFLPCWVDHQAMPRQDRQLCPCSGVLRLRTASVWEVEPLSPLRAPCP